MNIYSGTFGNGTTPENALNTALLQHPEIARTLIKQHPRYAATYLLERTGRYASEKVLGDNSFEWKVLGRYNKPSKVAESTSTYTAGTVMDVVFKDAAGSGAAGDVGNFLNLYDMVRLQSGATGIVTASGKKTTAGTLGYTAGEATSADDYIYQIELLDASSADDFNAGDIVASIGSAFPNGSLGSDVGENYVLPATYRNYLTVNRKKISITGKDATDVTWVENNGHRLWYFTREQIMMDEFMYQQELQRWYGKTTVTNTPDSYATAPTSQVAGNGGDIITGDGLLAQIDSSNQASYTGSLTEAMITDFIGKLSLNATASEGNEWVVFTGTEGRLQFHRAMKDLLVANGAGGAGIFSTKAGKEISLGGNFSTYYALGNKITLAYNPVFDDPNVHSNTAGTNAFSENQLQESAKMVFLDFGKTSGVSNIELITKGAEGINRSFTKRYVAGMINPHDQKSMMAANADDKFECHVLAESGIVVRNPLSCGILSRT